MDMHAPTTLEAPTEGAAHQAPAAHGGADHGEEHPHPKYFSIWFILLVVTLGEVVFAAVTPTGLFKGIGLVVMALYKVVLVALYFMHLKFEKKTMWVIASAPLIFGVILSIGVYPDSEHSTDAKKHGDLPGVEKHE
jgi:cytochrome c oxidase subunit 4